MSLSVESLEQSIDALFDATEHLRTPLVDLGFNSDQAHECIFHVQDCLREWIGEHRDYFTVCMEVQPDNLPEKLMSFAGSIEYGMHYHNRWHMLHLRRLIRPLLPAHTVFQDTAPLLIESDRTSVVTQGIDTLVAATDYLRNRLVDAQFSPSDVDAWLIHIYEVLGSWRRVEVRLFNLCMKADVESTPRFLHDFADDLLNKVKRLELHHARQLYKLLEPYDPEVKYDEEDDIAEHFAGTKAAWRAPFDALVAQLKAFGDEVDVSPRMSYILLLREDGRTFAEERPFGIVQVTDRQLDIGIRRKGVPADGCFAESGSWNAMVTHRVQIDDPTQIDAEVIAWLKEAYKWA